jgi:hypothetical protein
LAGDPDAEFIAVVVAAIAFVDMDTTGFDPGQMLQLGFLFVRWVLPTTKRSDEIESLDRLNRFERRS